MSDYEVLLSEPSHDALVEFRRLARQLEEEENE